MKKMAEYEGTFFNHMEGIYRPDDRDLVWELIEALGFVASEIRFTANSRPLIAAHPNDEDRDPTNNVFFLYEMPEEQQTLLDLIEQKSLTDTELRKAKETYLNKARAMPPIMPHVGLRYRSAAAVQKVMDALQSGISSALKKRIALFEVPAYKPIDGLPDIRQIFVRTDVFFLGAAGFEQAIELQVERGHG